MRVLLEVQWLEEPQRAELACGLALRDYIGCPHFSLVRSKLLVLLPPVSPLLAHDGHLSPATEGVNQSAVVCQAPCQLFLFLFPKAQTLDRWSSPLRGPLPEAIHRQQLGDRGQVAPEDSTYGSLSPVCAFYLFSPFAVAQEPKHPPLLSCMVKQPGPVPGSFTPGGWRL